MASDGAVNLTGNNKLQHLEQRFAADGFDYIGNAMPDLPLLKSAQQAMLANPDLRLNSALKSRNITVSRKFVDRSRRAGCLGQSAPGASMGQESARISAPAAGPLLRPGPVLTAVAAFFCFSFIASATYIFNDLLDLEADRVHLNKRKRAFAAGDLSVAAGLAISFTACRVPSSLAALPATKVPDLPAALSCHHAGLFPGA